MAALHRLLFRFVCCYWLLYALPDGTCISIFSPFSVPNGGEDSLAYTRNLLLVGVALAASLLWSILDRRRTDYRELHGWLRILVRYTLALTLFSYGIQKVIPVQFQPASLTRLMEPFGEFSPSGVLWSFVGASQAYSMFAGAAEVSAGLLLLFRRTTSLGALVSFAVLLNVVALNFFYDVPVKLYSVNLLLMAVFLLAPDLRRLMDVLMPDLPAPRFERRGLRIASGVVGVLLVGSFVTVQVTRQWELYSGIYVHPLQSPLYGLYRAESGAPDGWQKVAIESTNGITVRMANDTTQWMTTDYDIPKSTLRLNRELASLEWSRPDAGRLVLTGMFGGSPISMHLRRIDGDLPLLRHPR